MTGNGSFKQHLVLCVINTLEWLHSCTVNNQSRLEKGKKRRRKETVKCVFKIVPRQAKDHCHRHYFGITPSNAHHQTAADNSSHAAQ